MYSFTLNTLCLKKRHPFYICHNLVRCHPIYPILGRNMPHEICNKHGWTAHRTSFHMFVLYLVKCGAHFSGLSCIEIVRVLHQSILSYALVANKSYYALVTGYRPSGYTTGATTFLGLDARLIERGNVGSTVFLDWYKP